MSRITTLPKTVAELVQRLGVGPERIRMQPWPGTATEQDVIDIDVHENRLCELVDGVMVKKTVGQYESRVAVVLIFFLEYYTHKHGRGIVLGEAGTLRIMPHLVRIPDVSFISWKRLPGRKLPAEPIPDLAPNLAVEVISEGNTPKEMQRKLGEYFKAGVQAVWFIYPESRTAEIYASASKKREIGPEGILVGGRVLPGFRLSLKALFARAGKRRGE